MKFRLSSMQAAAEVDAKRYAWKFVQWRGVTTLRAPVQNSAKDAFTLLSTVMWGSLTAIGVWHIVGQLPKDKKVFISLGIVIFPWYNLFSSYFPRLQYIEWGNSQKWTCYYYLHYLYIVSYCTFNDNHQI